MLRRDEHVEDFFVAGATDTTDVVVLSEGLQVHDVAVLDDVGSLKRRRVTRDEKVTVGTEVTVAGRSRHIGSELKVHQLKAGRTRGRTERTVGLVGVSNTGQRQERKLVHPVGHGIGQSVTAGLTEVHHGLLIGQATGDAVCKAELVEFNRDVVGTQCFFVPFQGVVTGHTVAGHVSEQRQNCTRTFVGTSEFGDPLDHCVGTRTCKLVHEGHVASNTPEVATPRGKLFGSQRRKVSKSHGRPPRSVDVVQQKRCVKLRFQPTCGAANPFPVSWSNDLARIYEARPRHVLRRCRRGRF